VTVEREEEIERKNGYFHEFATMATKRETETLKRRRWRQRPQQRRRRQPQ